MGHFSRPTVNPPFRQLPPPRPLSKSLVFFTSIFYNFSFQQSHFYPFSLSFSHFHTSNLSKLHFHTFASFSYHLTRPQTSFILSISAKTQPPHFFFYWRSGGSSFFGSRNCGVKTRSGGVEPPHPPRQIRPCSLTTPMHHNHILRTRILFTSAGCHLFKRVSHLWSAPPAPPNDATGVR